MARSMIKDLKALEKSGDFWTRSRDDVVLRYVKQGPVLEAGCGNGMMTSRLLKKFSVCSTDIDKEGITLTKKINPDAHIVDFTKKVYKPLGKFSTILMLDSLEHMKYDEKALINANKNLKKNGRIIITVPYHQMFWTKNDTDRDHWRRYSKKDISKKLAAHGFVVEKIKFWGMMFLIPIIFAKLFRFRVPHEGVSDSPMNKVLYAYMRVENLIPLPIGSEIVCIARKSKEL